MTSTDQEMAPAMALALCASFGSVARWRDHFAQCAQAHLQQAGQASLAFDPATGALANRWTAAPAPVDANTLLALAYPGDAAQIGAWLAGVNWALAYERYQHLVHDASEPWAADPAQVGAGLLLDVRRAGVFEQAPSMLPAAHWRDPALVAAWGAALPKDQPVLVYCVYGHEVGRATALRLRALGVDARFLPGGIDAWQSAGKPVQAKGGVA